MVVSTRRQTPEATTNQKVCVCVCVCVCACVHVCVVCVITVTLTTAAEGGEREGEEEGNDGASSRITMSYQSTREVSTQSRDDRATVDISSEVDVRVSPKLVVIVTSSSGTLTCMHLGPDKPAAVSDLTGNVHYLSGTWLYV